MNRNYWNLKYGKEKNCMALEQWIDYIEDQRDYVISCKPLKLESACEPRIVVLLSYSHHDQRALECFTGTGANIPRSIGWLLGLQLPETIKGKEAFCLQSRSYHGPRNCKKCLVGLTNHIYIHIYAYLHM